MSVPMSQVLTTARTYLNDDAAVQFPDPVIIPKIQEAHRELQEELWVVGSPLVRSQVMLAYTAPQLTIAASIPPNNTPGLLPLDFLCPTALFENAAGSLISATGWIPMTEAFYIPLGASMAANLGWWAWQQEQLILAGATQSRAVVMQYRRLIPIPILATDPIGILFGESYLAARAAAMVAGTVGNKDILDTATALAKENLGKVISANRGQQKPLIKP